MAIIEMKLDRGPIKTYRKTATTKARQTHNPGYIDTVDGPAYFNSGDYICIGVKGEAWPMAREMFEAYKEQVTEPDTEGWAEYRNTNSVEAVQIFEPFTVTALRGALSGEPGDYLVTWLDDVWIVKRGIFETSYEEVVTAVDAVTVLELETTTKEE